MKAAQVALAVGGVLAVGLLVVGGAIHWAHRKLRERAREAGLAESAIIETERSAKNVATDAARCACADTELCIVIPAAVRARGPLSDVECTDPWGRAYTARCCQHWVEVRSRGRDGRLHTADDIVAETTAR